MIEIGNRDISNRLKVFRKQRKLTQVQIAKAAEKYGITSFQGQYSKIERGLRPLSTELLIILVGEYKLNISWLLLGKGKSDSEPEEAKSLVRDIKIFTDQLHILSARVEKLEKDNKFLAGQIGDLRSKL